MKIQRTKNATRNIFFGILYKAITILFPFITRTAMIYIMGTEYVGLNSLFTSILSFLSLTELGVGSALVYSMYKPIAEDDTDAICALLNLYRKLYRYIGLIMLVIGLCLLPFLDKLVSSDCPSDINLYILFLIYLLNSVLSYWMYGYKQALLTAHQRNDVVSKRSMLIQTCMYIVQIVMLFAFKNYYLYIIWLPIFTVFTNLANAMIVNRMYPQYKCRGQVPKEVETSIRKKVLALFGTKANSIVLHAADNIVISAFLGLIMVGKYGNYYYIMNAIIGIMTVVYESLTAGLGNSIETESIDKNYRDFKVLTFLNMWLVTFCSVCLLCLYQPFMRIWVGESNMFSMSVVILLVIYFYIYQVRRIILTYKDAAGLWWEDRFRPYVVMIVNIVGNLIMVQFIGIYGVILSTIISMLVSWPWENYTIFKFLFRRSAAEYYGNFFIYLIVGCAAAGITYLCCLWVPSGLGWFLVDLIICMIVPNAFLALAFCKRAEMRDSMMLIKTRYLNVIFRRIHAGQM